ncbi:hypothetical protein HZA96_01525 [Candidatus Woesearchaeota archaeon]|nr:hypothetical protein [Candidatus Woesearchaeota archaeon]
MPTTIQVNKHTLLLLKKIKEETASVSYDETIRKIANERINSSSMAGILGKRTHKWIMNDLRDKSDRF